MENGETTESVTGFSARFSEMPAYAPREEKKLDEQKKTIVGKDEAGEEIEGISQEQFGRFLEDWDAETAPFLGVQATLSKKLSVLPRVEKDGSSECPFAEDLYAAKEEAEEDLVCKLDMARRILPALQKLIERHRNNLEEIGAGASRIEYVENLKEMDQALNHQEHGLFCEKRRLRQLLKHITEMKQLLAESRKKKWPCGQPKKREKFSPSLDVNPESALAVLSAIGRPASAPVSLPPIQPVPTPVLPPSPLIGESLGLLGTGPIGGRPF